MRRNSGRLLISLAVVITAVAPFLADWNDSHIFSPQWSPHARFHGASTLGMTSVLASAALWRLWRRAPGRDAVAAAAMVPIAYWGPFYLAALIPGTGVEDPGHEVPRLAGVPTNLLGAGATVATSAAGWYLDRRVRAD